MKISKGRWLLILGIVLVVIDQVIKILVKTNMSIGEHFSVIGNWFQILFIENEGMAFGMKFGGMFGKFLSPPSGSAYSASSAGGLPVLSAVATAPEKTATGRSSI